MAEVTVFIPEDKLSDIPILSMINQFKLEVNRELLLIELVCKGGLMYLKLQGIPTDKDLKTDPSVHLTRMGSICIGL